MEVADALGDATPLERDFRHVLGLSLLIGWVEATDIADGHTSMVNSAR